MKKSMLRIFLSGILALSAFSDVRSSVANQVSTWESIGPSGGWIGALAVHPGQTGLMYAVAGSAPYGVYKTTNAGQSWQHVHDLNSSYFFEAVIDPLDPEKDHTSSTSSPDTSTGMGRSASSTSTQRNSTTDFIRSPGASRTTRERPRESDPGTSPSKTESPRRCRRSRIWRRI